MRGYASNYHLLFWFFYQFSTNCSFLCRFQEKIHVTSWFPVQHVHSCPCSQVGLRVLPNSVDIGFLEMSMISMTLSLLFESAFSYVKRQKQNV